MPFTKTILTAALVNNIANTASAVLTINSQASIPVGQQMAQNLLKGGVFTDDNGVVFNSNNIVSITVTVS